MFRYSFTVIVSYKIYRMQHKQNYGDFASNFLKIFIGGIPDKTSREEMFERFSSFGIIIDLVIIKDKKTNNLSEYFSNLLVWARVAILRQCLGAVLRDESCLLHRNPSIAIIRYQP